MIRFFLENMLGQVITNDLTFNQSVNDTQFGFHVVVNYSESQFNTDKSIDVISLTKLMKISKSHLKQ